MDFTRFEKARLIGARALQLAAGAPVLIKSKKTESDNIKLAKEELEKSVLPLTIKRKYPKDYY